MIELSTQLVPLSQLHLHLVDGCTLTCRPCRQQITRPKNGRGNKILPPDLAVQAVREAIPLGLRTVRLVGDTSLLYPGLGKLLDRLESLELNIVIETNGAGASPQSAQRLARIPRTTVWVGLDGADAATHDANLGKTGAYIAAIQGIHALAEAGLNVQVVFTVRRNNAGKIPDLIRLIEKLGGESILFNILEPGKPGEAEGGLQVEEAIALGWRIERELAHTTRLRLVFGFPPAFRGLHPRSIAGTTAQLLNTWDGRCAILNGLSLLSSGEYALCDLGTFLLNFILGRAGQDSLDLIWNSHPIIQVLRQGMPSRLEGVCKRCTLKQGCMSFCAGENYLNSGTFWKANWFCDTAEQAGLFPAGRLIENAWGIAVDSIVDTTGRG